MYNVCMCAYMVYLHIYFVKHLHMYFKICCRTTCKQYTYMLTTIIHIKWKAQESIFKLYVHRMDKYILHPLNWLHQSSSYIDKNKFQMTTIQKEPVHWKKWQRHIGCHNMRLLDAWLVTYVSKSNRVFNPDQFVLKSGLYQSTVLSRHIQTSIYGSLVKMVTFRMWSLDRGTFYVYVSYAF